MFSLSATKTKNSFGAFLEKTMSESVSIVKQKKSGGYTFNK